MILNDPFDTAPTLRNPQELPVSIKTCWRKVYTPKPFQDHDEVYYRVSWADGTTDEMHTIPAKWSAIATDTMLDEMAQEHIEGRVGTQQIAKMVAQVIDSFGGRPVWEIMRENEAVLGHSVIKPGETPWLSADDWDPTIVVSQSGNEVRLIAILAKRPGNGAFRRTIAAIIDAGLVPVIIAPTSKMAATMKRWHWFPRHVGSGWDHEEQWRPRKGWRSS